MGQSDIYRALVAESVSALKAHKPEAITAAETKATLAWRTLGFVMVQINPVIGDARQESLDQFLGGF